MKLGQKIDQIFDDLLLLENVPSDLSDQFNMLEGYVYIDNGGYLSGEFQSSMQSILKKLKSLEIEIGLELSEYYEGTEFANLLSLEAIGDFVEGINSKEEIRLQVFKMYVDVKKAELEGLFGDFDMGLWSKRLTLLGIEDKVEVLGRLGSAKKHYEKLQLCESLLESEMFIEEAETFFPELKQTLGVVSKYFVFLITSKRLKESMDVLVELNIESEDDVLELADSISKRVKGLIFVQRENDGSAELENVVSEDVFEVELEEDDIVYEIDDSSIEDELIVECINEVEKSFNKFLSAPSFSRHLQNVFGIAFSYLSHMDDDYEENESFILNLLRRLAVVGDQNNWKEEAILTFFEVIDEMFAEYPMVLGLIKEYVEKLSFSEEFEEIEAHHLVLANNRKINIKEFKAFVRSLESEIKPGGKHHYYEVVFEAFVFKDTVISSIYTGQVDHYANFILSNIQGFNSGRENVVLTWGDYQRLKTAFASIGLQLRVSQNR